MAAGLRVGWIVGTENVIDRLADIKMQTDYGSSSISQWICYEFLSKGYYEKFVAELREKLRVRRDFTIEILETYYKDIATWNKSSGGFYIWLRLNKQIQMYKLFEVCYKRGLIINPGSIYDNTNSRNIRISYSYATLADLETGLIELSKIIKENL